MSVFIFTGPTLSPEAGLGVMKATYLPPAAEGDVYRAALRQPRVIGIIDGYFQSTPAVRHKEILWAMSHGVHVFGSASMGALRAAELAAFGMEGVGTIFGWYRDGVIEDDDEVAVAHGPPENGFVACSEAMVNIRQTLRQAELRGILSVEQRHALEEIGKALFYPERTYSKLIRAAADAGLAESDLRRLEAWLPENRVDQKREDALEMLNVIRNRLKDNLPPKTVAFSFQHTAMWEQARQRIATDAKELVSAETAADA
ncbi:MAG: TfuA-like protein [Verrucomicrobiota bacterium]